MSEKGMKGKVIPIGARRAVHVFLKKDGGGYIRFESPITKGDFRDGKIIPRIASGRRKCQLITQVVLSEEALHALRRLLNDMLEEPHAL